MFGNARNNRCVNQAEKEIAQLAVPVGSQGKIRAPVLSVASSLN